MSNSPALPAARVADYFFVAGLHDNHLMPTFESAKKHKKTGDNDVFYYQQQEQAVANNGPMDPNSTISISTHPENNNLLLESRLRGQSLSVGPTEPSSILQLTIPEVATSASLLGVLDHVQNVIDTFDKERDTARDNVIAVHDHSTTEKYKRSDSDKTVTLSSNHRNSNSIRSIENSSLSHRDTLTRKWRSPSDPNKGEFCFFVCVCYGIDSTELGKDKHILIFLS